MLGIDGNVLACEPAQVRQKDANGLAERGKRKVGDRKLRQFARANMTFKGEFQRQKQFLVGSPLDQTVQFRNAEDAWSQTVAAMNRFPIDASLGQGAFHVFLFLDFEYFTAPAGLRVLAVSWILRATASK